LLPPLPFERRQRQRPHLAAQGKYCVLLLRGIGGNGGCFCLATLLTLLPLNGAIVAV
jgi:hypothetical protein